jgi:hypothetical protein
MLPGVYQLLVLAGIELPSLGQAIPTAPRPLLEVVEWLKLATLHAAAAAT